MEFLSDYGLFLAKTATVVIGVLIVIAAGAAAAAKTKKDDKGTIKVTHLNERIDKLRNAIRDEVEDESVRKLEQKAEKKKRKAEMKKKKKLAKDQPHEAAGKRVYVVDFQGDPRASQVESLRKVVTAVLAMIRDDQDEIYLRLESPGGMVHAYGLAASQLARIRRRNIPLTICVDKVAASGGYMMACLGNRIVAAPFAFIGSIGVLLQLPNFNRYLKHRNIDYEMITAGEYKRTLTLFGENTDKGRQKMTEEVQEIHDLFKDFVKEYRPALDIDAVATGETWFGRKALEKNLIDDIKTSDECIVEACETAEVYAVTYEEKKKITEKLSFAAEKALDNTIMKWMHRSPADHTS